MTTIRHIVMWNVRGDDAPTRARNLALLKSEFESLRGRVPGLLRLEVGIDESGVDYACDVVLVTDFASREALSAYAEHPEHLRVRRSLGDLRIARHQVDYEVASPSPLPVGDVAGHRTIPGDGHHVQAVR